MIALYPAATDLPRVRRRDRLLSRRQVRVLVGLLWLIDAGLQSQPDLFTGEWWRSDLAQSVMGQPHSISPFIFWWVDVIAAHAGIWNGSFVAIEAALGISLILGRFERAAIAASVPWALGIWVVGEGFGTLTTGFASFPAGAPGPVVFYVLLGLLAWPKADERAGGPAAEIAFAPAALSWAVLWAGGAALELPWRFPAGRVIQANLEEAAQGQPGWLAGPAQHAYNLVGAHPLLVPCLLAVAQLAVGLGVLHPRSRRPTLASGLALTVLFSVVFQDLGTIFGGDATDVGSAPLVLLLGLALWGLSSRATRARSATLPESSSLERSGVVFGAVQVRVRDPVLVRVLVVAAAARPVMVTSERSEDRRCIC